MASALILQARHLSKRFAAVTALDDVSFDLRAGEIHALCGENGAGKSTLIKLLSGVYPHGSYSGVFEIAGVECHFHSIRDAVTAGVAVIHQELALIEEMSVAENIVLGNEPRRFGIFMDRRRSEREAVTILAKLGLSPAPSQSVKSLGMGQKQLVQIARALAQDARILILDEPAAALDEPEVETFLGVLRDLRRRGVSCIYISHRLDEVFKIADRITVLRDGASVATLDARPPSEATVVRHMVGREISDLYARPTAAATPGPIVLAVRGLSAAKRGQGLRLRDISFELRAGEVLGIGGLMGAGRTELLTHLFGAWGQRLAGQVCLDGCDLGALPPRQVLAHGMALVVEDRRRLGLFLNQSVGFNLSLSSLSSLSCVGVIQRESEREANRRWFDRVRIKAPELTAVAGSLSGGNQQKVVLGRVLMTLPKVVMFDEPTRGIDIGAKREIYSLIAQLTANGCAVLLATSELGELIGLSDRILMLRGGTIGGSFVRDELTPEMLMRAAMA